MASGHNGHEPLDEELLQRPVRDYLGDDEPIAQTLTNSEVGVSRSAEEPTTVEPGPSAGAVAAVTDRRILFAVGNPAERDGDFTASVSYDELDSVDTRLETLTQSLVVETTDGEIWEFTARKAAAVDAAVDSLERALAEFKLAAAEDHRARAKAASDPARCAEALEAALSTYREAAELLGDESGPVSDAERTARQDAEAVIANLVSCHRDHGRESKAAGEWELAADNDESAYELFAESRDAFERALELARAYPPGDEAAIEQELATVRETLDPLKVEFAVAEAADD